MKLDRYYIFARIAPALITAVPLILFNHFYINAELSGFLHTVADFQWVAEIGMPVVFIFFLVFVSRVISKTFFEHRRYKGEKEMPTTNFLLFGNDMYSLSYKKNIHKKVFNDFNIKLLTPSEEKTDTTEARLRIIEAVSQIREVVKGGRLLLQHNIEYGFYRNLVGGSVIGSLVSLLCCLFFYFYYSSPLAFLLSVIGMIFYTIIVVVHPWVMDWLGNTYAKRLIQEYMQN